MKLAFVAYDITGREAAHVPQLWEVSAIIREDGAPRDSDEEAVFQIRPDLGTYLEVDVNHLEDINFRGRISPMLLRGEYETMRSVGISADDEEGAWTPLSFRDAGWELANLLAGAQLVTAEPVHPLALYVRDHNAYETWQPGAIDIRSLLLGYMGAAADPRGRGMLRYADLPFSVLLEDTSDLQIPDAATTLTRARIIRDVWDRLSS